MGTGTLTEGPGFLSQHAPYPQALADLTARLRYRPGWDFRLEHLDRGQGSEGLTLVITTLGYNAYHPERGETYRVCHPMPVPPAAYNEASWRMWLFEQLLLVEKHEAMEFFALAQDHNIAPDGTAEETLDRPYQPNHGHGWDPYLLTEVSTETDRRTNFRNEVVPGA
jgi:hypothetical protein